MTDVNPVLVVNDFELRNPIPVIALSFLFCLDVCIALLGSISAPTIEVTSSEILNPEPPLFTKLR